MADTGKQSPLGVNVIGSILDNIGFWINPQAESYMGSCKLTWSLAPGSDADYAKTSNNLFFGKTVEETSLKWVTWSINDAFFRGAASKSNPLRAIGTITSTTYNNMLSIGQDAATGGKFLPALGNSPPYDNWTRQNVNTWDPTYTWKNPHPELYPHGLAGPPAFSGYGLFSWTHPIYEGDFSVSSPFDPPTRVRYAYINEGQLASWWPFKATAPAGSSSPAGSTTTSSGPGSSGAPYTTPYSCASKPVDVRWNVTPGVYNSPGENTQNTNRAVLRGEDGTTFAIRIPPMTEYATEDGTIPVIFSISACTRPGLRDPDSQEWVISECPGDFDNPIPGPPNAGGTQLITGGYGSLSIAYDARLTQSRSWYLPGNPNKTYYLNIRYTGGTNLGGYIDLSQIYPAGVNWEAFGAVGSTPAVTTADSPTPDTDTGATPYVLYQGLGSGTISAERNKVVAIEILPPYIRQNRPLEFQNGWCETFDFQWVIATNVGTASNAKFNLSTTPGDMVNNVYTYTGATPYTPNTIISVANSPEYRLCWGTPEDLSILSSGFNNGKFYTLLDSTKTYYLNVVITDPNAAQFKIRNIESEGYIGGGTNWLSTPPASLGLEAGLSNPNCNAQPVDLGYEWNPDGSGIISVPAQGWQSPTKVTLAMEKGQIASFKIPGTPKFGQNNIDQMKLVAYEISAGPKPTTYEISISECEGDLSTVPRGPRQNTRQISYINTTSIQTSLPVGYDLNILNSVTSLSREKTYYFNIKFTDGGSGTLYLGVDIVIERQSTGLGEPVIIGTTTPASSPATGSLFAVPNRGITQWGWLRLIPLQAWNEFNFNNELIIQGYDPQRYWIREPLKNPEYRMFVDSFMSFYGFMQSTNDAIYAITNSRDFLKGTYSNMDDLVTADLSGVSLAFKEFGQDLLNLGKIIDWQYIQSFGLPSTLLKTLYNNNAINGSLNLALLTAGIPQARITAISTGSETATKEEEQQMYGAFLVIVGQDLIEILTICNCSTMNNPNGIRSLADCLNIKKMFPNSYSTLTVPTYNASQSAAQSAKTYYPLFQPNTGNVNPTLDAPAMQQKIGTLVPPGAPPIIEFGAAQSSFNLDNVELSVAENKVAAVDGRITADTLSVVQNVPKTATLVQENIDINPTVNTVATSTGEFLAQGFIKATAREIQNAPNIPAPNPQPATNLVSNTAPATSGQGIAPTTVLNSNKTSLGGGFFADDIGQLDDK